MQHAKVIAKEPVQFLKGPLFAQVPCGTHSGNTIYRHLISSIVRLVSAKSSAAPRHMLSTLGSGLEDERGEG